MKQADFTLIAHRGYSKLAPENTLQSFFRALLSGFDNIELDVHLTRDNQAVVLHDDQVDRTTNGHGDVSKLTLEEISNFQAGTWPNNNFTDRIPTLREVLSKLKGLAHLHIEIKSKNPLTAKIVYELLKNEGWLDFAHYENYQTPGFTITSFNKVTLEDSIKLHHKDVRHGWLVHKVTPSIVKKARKAGIQQVNPKAAVIKKNSIDMIKDAGLSVRAWDVKNDDDVIRAFIAGAEGATVNDPVYARSLISIV